MNALLESFVGEARDLLGASTAAILLLEKNGAGTAAVDDLFRAVHTIKGSSGLFDIRPFTALVHAAEDLLVAVRHGEIDLHPGHADLILDAFDQIASWLDALEAHQVLPEDAARVSAEQSQAIRAAFALRSASTQTLGPVASTDQVEQAAAAVLGRFSADVLQRVADLRLPITGVVYHPAPDCFFRADDPLATCLGAPALQALIATMPDQTEPLSDLDPFVCLLQFALISTAPIDDLADHFRYVSDEIQLVAIPDIVATRPGEATPVVPPAGPVCLPSALTEIIVAQSRLLALAGDRPGVVLAAVAALRNALAASGLDGAALGLAGAMSSAIDHQQIGPLQAGLTRLADGWIRQPSQVQAGPAASQHRLEAEPVPDRSAGRTGNAGHSGRVLKVPQEKIDLLMSLVGEFVVAKNSLPFLALRAEEVLGAKRLGQEIKAQYHVVDRLAQEMQEAVMQIRLLPVREAFQRFPRLIRDLAKALGKEIELVVTGEDTETDKNIIELLSDPLIHLIRNAIDHGIELPETRRWAGKAAAATIRLDAGREGDMVIVTVSDDGRGIDPDMIRTKAVEKNLLGQVEAAALTDREAVELVFRPGFSTAEQVSDLSGRGVGMDVVITTLRRAGGTVSIESQVGHGTAVRLAVPLSMTVTRVMIVEVGKSRFGLPMDLVEQTMKIERTLVRTVKRQRVFVLRDRIMPLHRLSDLLELDRPCENEAHQTAITVLRLGNDRIGLEVERFREGTDVIVRPLEGILSGLRGFAGTALMGDGQVLLILNPRDLVR